MRGLPARLKGWTFMGLLALLFGLPLLVLLAYAVDPGMRYPEVWPREADLRALVYVLSQWRVLALSLGSSLGYSLATVAACLALCLLPARVLARETFPGKTIAEGLLLAPALVPAMTFAMGAHLLFVRLGLTDTYLGLVLTLTAFSYPFMLRALVAGYQSFGPEYAVVAENLGASPLATFLRVELPLLTPSIIAGGSVVFLVAFSEYFLVFLIGGGTVPSYTGYLFPFLNSSDRATGAILTLIFLVVPVGLFLLTDSLVGRAYRARGMW